jgi:probable phosphoglycerate mutase
MKLPTIILLRHGQTVWNLEGRYQGHLNSNLTILGKAQAEENAVKLSREMKIEKPFKFFASPLGRARETAYIISDILGLNREDIIFDNNLKEIHYGIFEGKSKDFCQKSYSHQFQEREEDKWYYVLEGGGESYEMVEKRLFLWLERIKNEKYVVVVAHEMINRALRGIYCKYERDVTLQLRQNNDIVLKLENGEENIIE